MHYSSLVKHLLPAGRKEQPMFLAKTDSSPIDQRQGNGSVGPKSNLSVDVVDREYHACRLLAGTGQASLALKHGCSNEHWDRLGSRGYQEDAYPQSGNPHKSFLG